MRFAALSTAVARRSPVGRLFSPYQIPPVTRLSSLVISMPTRAARAMPARASSETAVLLLGVHVFARPANGCCRGRLRAFFFGAVVDAEGAHLLVAVAALALE